ncbi:MAG: hypothetical protein ACOCP5_04005 [Halanaerobiaceae bacterium]
MRNITGITQFIMELSFLLDKGEEISISRVYEHIEEMDIVDWLEEEYPYNNGDGVDFNLLREDFRKFFQRKLNMYKSANEGNETRRWGIKNNGLCLLICWSIEIVRDLYSKKNI